MSFSSRSIANGGQPSLRSAHAPSSCPSCRTELDAGTTPLDSIVLCARCGEALLWDGTHSLVTSEQIARLSERDRLRLHLMSAKHQAYLAARRKAN